MIKIIFLSKKYIFPWSILLLIYSQYVWGSNVFESQDRDYSLAIRPLDASFLNESSAEENAVVLKFGSPPTISTESLKEIIYEDSLSHTAIVSAASDINNAYPYLHPDGLPHIINLFKMDHLPDYTPPDFIRALYQTMYDITDVFNNNGLDYTLGRKTLLAFARHNGLCQWHKKIYFAVNAEDEEKLQESYGILAYRGYRLAFSDIDVYTIYATGKLKFKAPWEEEEFTVYSDHPLAVIQIYHKKMSGMEFRADRATKDDFIPQGMWDGKSWKEFARFSGNIQVMIIKNIEEYLVSQYGNDWKTHETYKNIKRKLTKEELDLARPSGSLKVIKRSSPLSCALL